MSSKLPPLLPVHQLPFEPLSPHSGKSLRHLNVNKSPISGNKLRCQKKAKKPTFAKKVLIENITQ